MDCIAVILAGGRGSRMALKCSKILSPICNKPILEYILDSIKNINFVRKFIVLGENKAEIQPFLPNDIEMAIQPIPRGTGDAFACACKNFVDFDGKVLLLNGDGPIVPSSTLTQIMSLNDAKMLIFTGFLPQNDNLGRIKRKNGRVIDIVEAKDCNPQDKKIMEKNLGIYCFDNKVLQKFINKLDCNNSQNEYYVTDLVKLFAENHQKITTFTQNTGEFYIPSVNTLKELAACQIIMQNYINQNLLASKVNILHPASTFVDSYSDISEYTTIYPNCFIERSKIGKNCIIYPNCVLKNAILSDNCIIGSNCVIEDSSVSSNIIPLSYIQENQHKK